MFDGNSEFPLRSDIPFVARVTAVTAGTGVQSGLFLYSWTEQAWSQITGFWVDASPARKGTPASGYAFEMNNNLLPVPFYVWMRFRGAVRGVPTYDFQYCCALASSSSSSH